MSPEPKKIPGAKSNWRRAYKKMHQRQGQQLDRMALFVPNSAGKPRQLLELALLDAERVFPFAQELVSKAGHTLLPIERTADFATSPVERAAAQRLGELFDMHGSDKANPHDYHLVYGPLISRCGALTAMLEVGLGTNKTDVASHMGVKGRPGASLRAFRDFVPDANIYGADIDTRVLFEEPRIKTFHVDQLNLGTLDSLSEKLPPTLDLVIDDGLHSPAANVAVLTLALRHVRPGGWAVIEDIGEAALPVWQVVGALLASTWQCRLVKASGGYLFLAQRKI